MNKILFLFCMSLLTLTANISGAQEATDDDGDQPDLVEIPAPSKTGGKKNSTIKLNFENELVTGSAPSPSVDFILKRSQFNNKKLIRLRDNFVPEAEQDRENFNGNR